MNEFNLRSHLAGNPSVVFDCIYNTTVKSRTLRDPEFKIFLVGQFHQLFLTRYR